MSNPQAFTPEDAMRLGPQVRQRLQGMDWPTEKAVYKTMSGSRRSDLSGAPDVGGAYVGRLSLDEFFAKIQELAAGARTASVNNDDLKKEASANFQAQMEAAFHTPSRTPFGR